MGATLLEGRKSGVESLANGNVLICESSKGQITEVEKQTGNVIWVYKNPLGSQLYPQGSAIPSRDNSIFRAQRYSDSFSGFVSRDLSPKGLIENSNSVSSACITLDVEKEFLEGLRIANPVEEQIVFSQEIEVNLKIFNLTGQLIVHIDNFVGAELPVVLPSGIYVIELNSNREVYRQKLLFR